jgi:hypothetical protein
MLRKAKQVLEKCDPVGRVLSALIQQRTSDVYRRQRPTPLLSRTAKSRHQSQLEELSIPVHGLARRLTATCAGLAGSPAQNLQESSKSCAPTFA